MALPKRDRTATKAYDPLVDGLNDSGRLGKVSAFKGKKHVKKTIKKKATVTKKKMTVTKKKIAAKSKMDGTKMKKKVMVSGCYDLLHSGHVAFFKDASAHGDLYVSVGSDACVTQLKKVTRK